MTPKNKSAVSIVIAAVLFFCIALVPVSATYQSDAYYAFVDEIYRNLDGRETSFSVNYKDGLTSEVLESAIRDAISYSVSVALDVTDYTTDYTSHMATIHVQYTPLGYDKKIAFSIDDVERIISKTISDRQSGVSIYLTLDAPIANITQDIFDAYLSSITSNPDNYASYAINDIWVSCESLIDRVSSDSAYKIVIKFNYRETLNETAAVNRYVSEFISSLNLKSMTNKEVVQYINDKVKSITTYDLSDAMLSYIPYGIVSSGLGGCQAYSMLTSAMLWEAGIPNRLVTGTSKNSSTGSVEDHMWNAVYISGQWLHLDTTWNDNYPIGHDPYFLLSEQSIRYDHVFDSTLFNYDTFDSGVAHYKSLSDSIIRFNIGSPVMQVGKQQLRIDPLSDNTVPVILENRTHLPVRSMIESIGGSVTWDGATSTVGIEYGGLSLKMTLGSTDVYINGIKQRIETPPVIINDRTMIPVRFAAELLNMNVSWQAQTQLVTISPPIAPFS